MDDRYVPREEAKVDIEDRGYQFGDGIYEVVGVYSGKAFMLDRHLTRLQRSAGEIGLTLPCSTEELRTKLLELIAKNRLDDGIVYFQVTRGVAPRTHHFPHLPVKARLIAYTKAVHRPTDLQEYGVSCVLAEDIRWHRCDIKTLNLLGNVLAKQQAVSKGAFEAILHRGDTVTEGSSTNAFIVKNGQVLTHPANRFILSGITRSAVIEACRRQDIPFSEKSFTIRDMLQADEAFISGTQIDVLPVTKIDGHQIGNGVPGPVTRAIQEHFRRWIAAL
jgi:D-alanine transaminase